MKVYSFDIDHNLHITSTPTHLEKRDGTQRIDFSVDPLEFEGIKGSIDGKMIRRKNNDRLLSLQEFGDDSARGRKALLLDILEGDTGPSHKNVLEAVKQGKIIRVNTARMLSEQTLREIYREHIRSCLHDNEKEITIGSIRENYDNISREKEHYDIWVDFMARMSFYAVNNSDLERLMIHKFPDFPHRFGDMRKARTIHHDILLLENYNPMQYVKKHDEWEYGHSDDQEKNLTAIAEEVESMKKQGLIKKFDKFVLWNTSDPDNVTKETIQIS